MNFEKIVCVIVDAYSTGKNLALAFKARGYPCIHIKSSEQLPENFQHRKEDFIKSLTYIGDIDEIIKELQEFKVKLCVPGYESGVALADLLSEILELPGNGTQLSTARRNKFEMIECVAKAGISTVQHFKSDDLNRILNWVKENNLNQVVLKPLDSANGDGVYFCNTKEEISAAFKNIISKKNQFGEKNQIVLTESYNEGEEYIVNTVSWENKHFTAEIWHITRRVNTTIYEKAEIVDPLDAIWPTLIEYTKKVLNALGIKYGAGTTELKYSRTNGPILIETSSRLMGGAPLILSQEVIGYTQLSLMIEAYLEPDVFLKRFEEKPGALNKMGMAVLLISNTEGKLTRNLNFKQFASIQSLIGYKIINIEQGNIIFKTIDSLTSPGEIYLLALNKQQLEEDYKRIRNIEADDFYTSAVEVKVSTHINQFFATSHPADVTNPTSVLKPI